MNNRFDPSGTQVVFDEDDIVFAVTDMLFNVDLHGHYVFVIEQYEDGDIEGTLVNQPFEILGPFETQFDAIQHIRSLINSSSIDSQLG
jgi:hypothetical protein